MYLSGPYMTVNFWTHNETLAERHDRTSEIDHLVGISFHVSVIPGPDPITTKTTTTTVATTTTMATTTTVPVTTTRFFILLPKNYYLFHLIS